MRIPNGATLAYPPGWERIRSDPATASAALTGRGDRILGYLNITPQQGDETMANWRTFRIHHNGEEGDRDVTRLAAASGLRFLTGRGSCVRDSYLTETGNRYVELACLVAGRQATTVVVGAVVPDASARVAPLVERAISGLST
jgi:hypothetical protein